VERKKPGEMNSDALIFTHTITPRIEYIANFLSNYYKAGFGVTSSIERFKSSEVKCKINYSQQKISNSEIWIHPHVLLFESSVRQVKIDVFHFKQLVAFFETGGDYSFDLFAAIFYLISRYEEYLPYKKDLYGRYAHENSLAFKENFLNVPLVNHWLEDFRKILLEKSSAFSKQKQFSFIPTYDNDIAWSYLNKGFLRNSAGLIKDIVKLKWSTVNERIKVLRGKSNDPFDSYQWMFEIHSQFQLDPIYFFLVATKKGRYDKNIPVDNVDFTMLVQSVSNKYEIGLHPSWISNDRPALINKEKEWLEKMINRSVVKSRQHYIRFQPQTLKRLIPLDIHSDYSMGYGTINGFRASISDPYYWYDLKSEKETQLLIHPFCFMDANAYYEQKMTPSEALDQLMQFLMEIKTVNGTMITIFHNNFLGTDKNFDGWRTIYTEFINTVKKYQVS
jgi:hypothetical protein